MKAQANLLELESVACEYWFSTAGATGGGPPRASVHRRGVGNRQQSVGPVKQRDSITRQQSTLPWRTTINRRLHLPIVTSPVFLSPECVPIPPRKCSLGRQPAAQERNSHMAVRRQTSNDSHSLDPHRDHASVRHRNITAITRRLYNTPLVTITYRIAYILGLLDRDV